MQEVVKALLFQIAGYLVASLWIFALFGFWMRGYFFAYVKVRTSLGKLVLAKLIGPNKIIYKVAKIEQGSGMGANLTWGKPGKDRVILNKVKREYLYVENNVTCIDIDLKTYAFMPKETHYARELKALPKMPEFEPLPENASREDKKKYEMMVAQETAEYELKMQNYAKVFTEEGNEVVITGIEGFDPVQVDNLVHGAQYRPSPIMQLLKLLMIICIIGLLIGGLSAVAGFITGETAKKCNTNVDNANTKLDTIIQFIKPPQVSGSVTPTGG